MIDPKELRIGNIIWDDTRQKIKYVNHRVISDLASHYSPLPYSAVSLNKEWFVKFMFESYEYKLWTNSKTAYRKYWNNERILINKFYSGEDSVYVFYTETETGIGFMSKEFKYVHQLQNIVFDLTGQEL